MDMAISEISIAGQAFSRSAATRDVTAAAQPERQVLSPGGNASPPASQEEPRENSAEISPETTEQAIAMVRELLQSQARSLQFEVDEQSGVDIVTVLDGDTGEVIRRFPSDEVVASARFIAENMPNVVSGLLLDEQG